MLAHELVNQLSVIIGNCDLVREKAPVDSECTERLLAMRETARSMAAKLSKHQCELTGLMRAIPEDEWPEPSAKQRQR